MMRQTYVSCLVVVLKLGMRVHTSPSVLPSGYEGRRGQLCCTARGPASPRHAQQLLDFSFTGTSLRALMPLACETAGVVIASLRATSKNSSARRRQRFVSIP
jgi:hypothetical protein